MNTKTLKLLLVAAFVCLAMPTTVSAQSPAALPMKGSIPAAQASAIDGVWTISTLGKRIRIEGGRAYALDPWTHALFWQIQPDMVVLTNFRRLEAGAWLADDLPLTGSARMKLASDGNIDVSVKGALVKVKYRLIKQTVDDQGWFAQELSSTDFSSNAAFAGTSRRMQEPVETWQVYVKQVWCTGSGVGFVKDATGNISVNASRAGDSGRTVTTGRKKVNAECKKKFKKQSYRYGSDSPGMLVLTGTREQIANYTINYSFEWWYGRKHKKSRTDRKRYKRPSVLKEGLEVSERKDYTWKIDGGAAPDFYLRVRFRRTK